MHFLVHVVTEPSGSVEDAMEPFRERYGDENSWVGHWDYWSIGGRWAGHFAGTNVLPAREVLEIETEPRAPYAYVTQDGKWIASEDYFPAGFPGPTEDHPGRKSHFRPVEGYAGAYRAYLASVPNALVTTVDIHS